MDSIIVKCVLVALLVTPSLAFSAEETDITEQQALLNLEEMKRQAESEPSKDDKACGAIICITGEMIGISGGSECNSHIDDYFDIKKKRLGVFSPSRTLKARTKYLNRCDTVLGKANAQAINSAFGTLPVNPF